MADVTPQQTEASRRSTRRSEFGKLTPRVFTKRAFLRFDLDRRRAYLAELPGPPTIDQSNRIDSLIRAEWRCLKANARAEREDSTTADAIAARAEQTLENIRNRWHLNLVLAKSKSEPSLRGRSRAAGPPQATYDEHMALLRARQAGGGRE
jgi:hypothetical protein